MKAGNMFEQLNAMQRLVRPTPDLSDMVRKNANAYWRSQDQILNIMQAFADGWFARRHAGTRAALEAAERICAAQNPADMAREYQDWASGAFQRLAADAIDCQRHCMAIVGGIAPDIAPPASTMQTEPAAAELRQAVRSKAA